MNNQYAAFFAALKTSRKMGNSLSRAELVSQFTEGRTASLKELDAWELNEITIRLNHLNLGSSIGQLKPQATVASAASKSDRMRKAIIAIFHKMDRPPAAAIAWAEKQGVKGVKKRFNDYSNQELYQLILVSEKVLKDYLKAIRKKLSEL